jgi:hypothetical protein
MREFRGWRAVSQELAEIVETAGPRIVLAGAVVFAMAAVAMLLRFWILIPGWTA